MINDRISGCVIAFNAAASIEACIDSLRLCDEIVIIDTHSTDRTRDIATARGARVIERGIERDWIGQCSQKQFAVREAKHDWIISLDADERMSALLESEILAIRPYGLGEFAGYRIGFPEHHDRHPNDDLRLFDRRRSTIRREDRGEKVIAFGPVGNLRGRIVLDSPRGMAASRRNPVTCERRSP